MILEEKITDIPDFMISAFVWNVISNELMLYFVVFCVIAVNIFKSNFRVFSFGEKLVFV